jgi:hypothetical protein
MEATDTQPGHVCTLSPRPLLQTARLTPTPPPHPLVTSSSINGPEFYCPIQYSLYETMSDKINPGAHLYNVLNLNYSGFPIGRETKFRTHIKLYNSNVIDSDL